MAKILDGKAIAAQIRAELKTRAEALRAGGAGIGEAALQSGFLSPNTYYRALAREKSRQGKEVRATGSAPEKS